MCNISIAVLTVLESPINQFLVVNGEIVTQTNDRNRTDVMAEFVYIGISEFANEAIYLSHALNAKVDMIILNNAIELAEYITNNALLVNPTSVFEFLFDHVAISPPKSLKRGEDYSQELFGMIWTIHACEDIPFGSEVTIDSSSIFEDLLLMITR